MKIAAWAGVFLAAAAVAGPFRASDVPAEAEWWLHLDVEQLKTTGVGKCLLDLLSSEEAERKMEAFRAVFGFDPRKDLNSITLGGAGARVAVIVRGRLDTERLTVLLRASDGYEAVGEGTRTLHSWIDEKKAKKDGRDKARMCGAFHGSGAAVISDRASVVGHVLDVMDGARPSLAGPGAEVPGDGRPVLSGRMIGAAAPNAKNEVLKSALGGHVTIGEANGQVHGRLEMELATPEQAGNIRKVLDGMKAAALLNSEKDPRAARLAEALTADGSGATVGIRLTIAAEEITRAMREEAARKEARKSE